MPISWFLALRFFREGRLQSVLIVVGVSVGVAVMVFLSALIDGLQTGLVAQTLGTQAHVVVRPPDEVARPMLASSEAVAIAARVERTAQVAWLAGRDGGIAQFGQIELIAPMEPIEVDPLDAVAGALRTAVSPTVTGPAVAIRGNATRAVVLYGVDPERFAGIYPIRQRMVAGRFEPTGTGCVIGRELALDLGVGEGDRLRLGSVEGASEVYTVVGVFDLGNREVNRRWVVITMRGAQTLLDLVGAIAANRPRDRVLAALTLTLLCPDHLVQG